MGSIPTRSTKHRRRKWWTRTPDKRVISRFDSCSVYQISECDAVAARRFGEPEGVGSIPTTQTIRVAGRADMQPPFKRRYPGSTPGRPPNFNLWLSSEKWAFGRTVMHLTLNQADVGSTPTAPPKDAPVTQLADVSGLKLESCEFDSRQGYCGDGATAARKAHNLYISGFNSRPRHRAGVVQVASIRVS